MFPWTVKQSISEVLYLTMFCWCSKFLYFFCLSYKSYCFCFSWWDLALSVYSNKRVDLLSSGIKCFDFTQYLLLAFVSFLFRHFILILLRSPFDIYLDLLNKCDCHARVFRLFWTWETMLWLTFSHKCEDFNGFAVMYGYSQFFRFFYPMS